MVELQQQYKALFNTMAQGAFFENADGSLEDVNPAALEMFGLDRAQFQGRKSLTPEWKVVREDKSILPPEQYPSTIALNTGKEVRNFAIGIFNPQRNAFVWLTVNAIPMFKDDSTSPHQVFVTLHEITSRKHEEERLCLLNECFLNFCPDTSKNINRLTAAIGRIMNASCALYNRLGDEMLCSIGQWQAPPGYQAVDKPDGHICFDVIRNGSKTPLIINDLDKTTYAESDPNVCRYDLKTYIGVPVFWGNEAVGSLCTVFCDNYTPTEHDLSFMTIVAAALGVEEARWRAETALVNSEARFSIFMKYFPGLAFIKDSTSRVLFVNEQYRTLLGLNPADMLGKTNYDLFPADFAEKITRDDQRVVTNGKMELIEEEFAGRTWSTCKFPIEQPGQLPLLAGINVDISERKQAEENRLNMERQLLYAQKLESLGVLAGGIAHDFNNILTSIVGNTELAKMKLNPESPAIDNLQKIEKSAARAADLAKQMLAYSGKGRFVVENIDLNRLLSEMIHMLEVSISKKATIHLNLHSSLPPVHADATQIRQIIMNLVINASDAIGDTIGVIAISTGSITCNLDYLKDVWLNDNIVAGEYVYFEVADTGCGMTKETMTKIFDPFFTTKFTGRGLGMAAVLGIIRGHKGSIKIQSELGKGTTFKVLLPANGGTTAETRGIETNMEWHGSGTILLVDDEEEIRDIGTNMLQSLGFDVTTAGDGQEALDIYKAQGNISFVILDLTMPQMDGEEAFRKLCEINPKVKVIISSGYSEYEVTKRFSGKGMAGFIQKPYRLSELRDVIKSLTKG